MAQKKITDLTLRSSFDATVNLPGDDTSQTWRVTGAQIRDYLFGSTLIGPIVDAFTAKTAPVAADEFLLADSAASYAAKKITKSNLLKKTVRSVTTTDSVAATDEVMIASGASFTFTLPAASGMAGKIMTFIHNDSSLARIYTIDGNASETINSALTAKISTIGEALTIICDGSNWFILERRIPSVWTSFTPTGTWSANTTYAGQWRRVGDSMEMRAVVLTSGAPTSATLTVNLPSNVTIDIAKLGNGSPSDDAPLGTLQVLDAGNAAYFGTITYTTTTALRLDVVNSASTYASTAVVTQAVPITFGSGDKVGLIAKFPITNWEG